MTVRGHIKNGTVVLDEPVGLPDGMDVEVEVRPLSGTEQPHPTWGEVFSDLAGSVEGLPTDMAENHDHYIHGTPKRTEK
jgi:hypothetical protein